MFDKKGEDGDKTRLAMYPSIPASWSCTGNLYRYLPASSLSLFMDRSRNARRKWNMATLTFYSYELS